MDFVVRPTRSGNLISVSIYKMDRSSYDLQDENQGNICDVSSIVPDIWQAFSKGTTIIASLIPVSFYFLVRQSNRRDYHSIYVIKYTELIK